ncbi:hypothetical protein GCM10027568_09540 [Humibacter soli]
MNSLPPRPRPIGFSDDSAVQFCREWMVYLGEVDTVAAAGEAAAVCDLYSSRYVALVENRIGNIDEPLVGRAAALVASDGRRGLVFHSGGCLPDAAAMADSLGIALFRFVGRTGGIEARNRLAAPIVRMERLP